MKKNIKTSFTLGIEAEEKAIKYLLNNQYLILAQRFKTKFGEIDILAKENNTIICIEVKKRQTLTQAAECITLKQQERIINAYEYWLQLNHINPFSLEVRLDVILIAGNQLQHIKNAFQS